MKRSTPLKRKPFVRKAPEPEVRPERIRPVARPLVRAANYGQPANEAFVAVPKHDYVRSPALLAAVRKLPCMHTGAEGRTEPAHSNWGRDAKGKGIKADDNRIAALAVEVHRELDQGKNWTQAERKAIWWNAHVRTVRALLASGAWPPGVPVPDLSTPL